jgi:RecA/RadA recombinase
LPRKAKSSDTSDSEGIESALLEQGEETSSGRRRSRSTETKGRGAFWVSSGSDLMDIVVGGGRGYGYETGLVVVLESDSGHGKSFAGHEIIAAAYHKHKDKCKWQYQDVESGCTFDSKTLYGVEIMPPRVEDRVRPQTVEDCLNEIVIFGEKIKEDEFGIIVVDSIDGLLSTDTKERVDKRANLYAKGKDLDEGSYGMQKAKFLSQEFFPTINALAERKNLLIIIMAQYREAAGQYGAKKVLSNGKALPYYPHIRVKFLKKEEIEIKGRAIGAVIQAETVKMKGPAPFRKCNVVLHYSRGIDNTTTNIDYLYDLRTAERAELKKSASEQMLAWDDKEMNRLDLIRYIEDNNQDVMLTKAVHEKWEAEEAEAAKQLEGRKSRYA